MVTTMKDVAMAAGVSPATVSRVLNEKVEVGSELRERVITAVAELGYRPNGLARSLRTQATQVLGVVISDITNPFFTSVVRGVEDAAQGAGYSVILANTDEDLPKERRYLEVAVAEQFAGVVLSPASSQRTDLSVLTRHGIPVVTVDRQLRSDAVDSVLINNYRAAKEVTRHLVEQGCRRIALISGPANTTTGERRLVGFRAALREAGLRSDATLIRRADFRVDGGYEAARELLSAATPPDALLVSNNLMSIGALQAIGELGVRVPHDLAFAAFDGIGWARALRPTLTVVEQPTYEIGRRATELLLDRIRGGERSARRVVLRAQLKVSSSSLRIGA